MAFNFIHFKIYLIKTFKRHLSYKVNDIQENQVHVQLIIKLVINKIVLTFSYHHFSHISSFTKPPWHFHLHIPSMIHGLLISPWVLCLWIHSLLETHWILYFRVLALYFSLFLEERPFLHSWKYNCHCSRDPKVLEMLGQWEVYKVQRQVWTGAGLNLADKLCVLWISELEKWAYPSPLEPMSESQMLDTKI